ncbi:hypothetical protein [Pseudarthrobacter sp. NIBRBAC000502770]|uniref:hypothetical protein n=1 Tax=Pseudarthrobacter sp. NIBRBAC000502770 TaxID=2590785 RepID=UPI00113FF8DF|nr:hypothetical protein [Pseudarthrobacter sp. NIBRBAC000502770]QDG87077.1 hypothetical protein NIBR502770_00170 [Pseudarthrobacter sp. NIBRBAC000502770]
MALIASFALVSAHLQASCRRDGQCRRLRDELRNGGTIRIRTRTGANRTLRLRVQQMPGEVMTWTGGLPLGLFTGVRTLKLEPRGGMTHLRVKEEFTGPLRGLPWKASPDMQQAFTDYVDAVKERAEILDGHRNPG